MVLRIRRSTARADPRTRDAVAYVECNLAQQITLQAAADACCLSRFEFSRAFKREHGVTFVDYVLSRRVHKAAELLVGAAPAIKEVAYEVGFNDPSYFGRIFRRYFGLSPSQYQCRQPSLPIDTFPVDGARVTESAATVRAREVSAPT